MATPDEHRPNKFESTGAQIKPANHHVPISMAPGPRWRRRASQAKPDQARNCLSRTAASFARAGLAEKRRVRAQPASRRAAFLLVRFLWRNKENEPARQRAEGRSWIGIQPEKNTVRMNSVSTGACLPCRQSGMDWADRDAITACQAERSPGGMSFACYEKRF